MSDKIQFCHNGKIDVQFPFKLCITIDTLVLTYIEFAYQNPRIRDWEQPIAWKGDVVGQKISQF